MSKFYVLVNQLKLTWRKKYVTKSDELFKNKHYYSNITYKATDSSVGLFFSVCVCDSIWVEIDGNLVRSIVWCCLQLLGWQHSEKNSDFVKPIVKKPSLTTLRLFSVVKPSCHILFLAALRFEFGLGNGLF